MDSPKDNRNDLHQEQAALQGVLDNLSQFDKDTQQRLLRAVSVFLDIQLRSDSGSLASTGISTQISSATPISRRGLVFSDHTDLSAKEFLLEKQPQTDIERAACLAFYLTHYQDTPHFKTIDISKLNTEAAQSPFSNTAYAVSNATQKGFLAAAGKGTKQITAAGEQFIAALPDREAADNALKASRPRRKKAKRKSRAKKS